MSFIMVRSVLGTAGHSLLKPSIVRMSSIVLSHRSRMFSNLPTSSHSLPIAQHSPAVQALPLSTSNASQLSTASSGIFTTQTSSTPTSLIHSYQAAPFSTSVTPAATAATAGTTANAGPQKGTENNQNENQEDQFSWIDKVCYNYIHFYYCYHDHRS